MISENMITENKGKSHMNTYFQTYSDFLFAYACDLHNVLEVSLSNKNMESLFALQLNCISYLWSVY